MSYMTKPFEELDVLDNFLMNAIAMDTEVGEAFCRRLLSVLLQREIGKIHVAAQYTLPAQDPNYRGIRMDVKVEEAGDEDETANVYDLEPHLRDNLDLPRHNRFYQAKMDSRYMKRGNDDFSKMPSLFVITILNYDPFGRSHMVYTFENRCLEVPDLEYGDGLRFLYFYAGGTEGGNEAVKNLLRYLQHSRADYATDEATKELHGYVSRVKTSPEVRAEYMKFEEFLEWEKAEAAEKATKEATEKADKKRAIQDILDLLEDYGDIPDILKQKLEQTDSAQLRNYLKLAARADSIGAFMETLE